MTGKQTKNLEKKYQTKKFGENKKLTAETILAFCSK